MLSYKGVDENLKFLILEIKKQLDDTLNILEDVSLYSMEKVSYREDYIDYLKTSISKKSYNLIASIPMEDEFDTNKVMTFNVIAGNLEKIGDHLENIIRQASYLKNKNIIKKFRYQAYFNEIIKGLNLIEESFFGADLQKALIICETESTIDRLFEKDFRLFKKELKATGKNIDDYITTIFIFRYFERIGDALLNIGEGVISSVTGTRIKFNQYLSMKETLDIHEDDFSIETVGDDTRSGCMIGKLSRDKGDDQPFVAIYKEGKKKKIFEEKEKILQWEQIYPGVTPKILKYETSGAYASLLMEYLHGKNFYEILITKEIDILAESLARIINTLNDLWTKTKTKEKVNAHFIRQLNSRLTDVFRLHPYFQNLPTTIGSLKNMSIKEMLKNAQELEEGINAPFSVFIHGDLNNDNIIYNENIDKVHFIDLHRSNRTDYVQDVSVFLISNFRLPLFDKVIRKRINNVIDEFYDFVVSFAKDNSDDTFTVRLALGLIRSFITSTRFSMKKDFAQDMFFRGVYLLEKVIEHEGPWKDFRINKDILIYN